jgi:hypothetical protein
LDALFGFHAPTDSWRSCISFDGFLLPRDYHLLLDEQAEQIFAMTDNIAERARKPRPNAAVDWRNLARTTPERQR